MGATKRNLEKGRHGQEKGNVQLILLRSIMITVWIVEVRTRSWRTDKRPSIHPETHKHLLVDDGTNCPPPVPFSAQHVQNMLKS